MDAKIEEKIVNAILFGKRLFLTFAAGMFAFVALLTFIMSIADKMLIGFIMTVIFGYCAAICWSIRKD